MLLSIITPTFNRINFLKKNLMNIDFIYSQFKSIEWIIIVENNNKKIINFIKKLKRKYIVVIVGSHKSAELAFERGVKKSKGKYINFHGDDDFFNLKYVNLINKQLFSSNHKWIIFEGSYINNNYQKIRRTISFFKKKLLMNYGMIDISIINYIMTPSVFIRSDIYKKIGGLGIIKRSGSDYVLWMNLNKKFKPKIISKELTFAMITNKTISGKFEIEKYIFLYKKMLKNKKGNFISSILISCSILLMIIYNFLTKKIMY